MPEPTDIGKACLKKTMKAVRPYVRIYGAREPYRASKIKPNYHDAWDNRGFALSPGTVRKYLDNIYFKLEVESRAEAIAQALEKLCLASTEKLKDTIHPSLTYF